jgi:hypothetical protein
MSAGLARASVFWTLRRWRVGHPCQFLPQQISPRMAGAWRPHAVRCALDHDRDLIGSTAGLASPSLSSYLRDPATPLLVAIATITEGERDLHRRMQASSLHRLAHRGGDIGLPGARGWVLVAAFGGARHRHWLIARCRVIPAVNPPKTRGQSHRHIIPR